MTALLLAVLCLVVPATAAAQPESRVRVTRTSAVTEQPEGSAAVVANSLQLAGDLADDFLGLTGAGVTYFVNPRARSWYVKGAVGAAVGAELDNVTHTAIRGTITWVSYRGRRGTT